MTEKSASARGAVHRSEAAAESFPSRSSGRRRGTHDTARSSADARSAEAIDAGRPFADHRRQHPRRHTAADVGHTTPRGQRRPDPQRGRGEGAEAGECDCRTVPPGGSRCCIDRLVAAGSGRTHSARHYLLKRSKEDRAPLLVYYHGGGFVVGGFETHGHLAEMICHEGGVHVLLVDYRLAPEHKAPAAVDDAYAAYRWAVDHAAELGADSSRIAVGGDSAVEISPQWWPNAHATTAPRCWSAAAALSDHQLRRPNPVAGSVRRLASSGAGTWTSATTST